MRYEKAIAVANALELLTWKPSISAKEPWDREHTRFHGLDLSRCLVQQFHERVGRDHGSPEIVDAHHGGRLVFPFLS